MGFKKARESLYNDDGVETDKTYTILVSSLACCSVPLLTQMLLLVMFHLRI